MSDDNPIIFGSDGWYDALTGERIDTTRLGRENSKNYCKVCNTCQGRGTIDQFIAVDNMLHREVYQPARCPACKGTGKAVNSD